MLLIRSLLSYAWRMSAMGHFRPNPAVRAMSAIPPVATG
jgi:hypothetical protein